MKGFSVALICSAIASLTAAQSLTTPSPAIGDLIAQGIGAASTTLSAASSSQSLHFTNTSSVVPTHSLSGNATIYNCTDSACGLACSSSWSSWSSASTKWVRAFATTSTSIVSHYNATVAAVPIATSNGSVYATCDGIPRYSGVVDYWTTTNSSIPATSTTWYEIATATGKAFSEPKPSCVIAGDQCDDLISEWHASNYLAFPFNQSTGFYDYWPNGPPIDFPHCNTSQTKHATEFAAWLNDTFLADGSGCWVKGARARLFYWPEAVTEGNKTEACPSGSYTPAPELTAANATAPVTKVVTLSETYYNCCTTTLTMTSPTMYLSMQDVEGKDASWGFAGQGPIAATVVPIAPGDLISQVIAPPLITNEALSSSAMSVIAHQEVEKYTDLFGYNWQQHQSGLGGPNIPLQTVVANPADLGKPPQPLSYYFGAAGWYCLNANPFAAHYQPVSAGLPPGMKCDTIYDDYYRPWVQIPSTMKAVHHWSTCNLMFGWDPPIALTTVANIAGPSTPGQVSATKTTDSAAQTTRAVPGSPSITETKPTAEPDHVTNGDLNTARPADRSQQGQTQTSSPAAASPAFLTPLDQPSPQGPAQEVNSPTKTETDTPPAVIGTIGSGGAAVTIVSDPAHSGQVVATSRDGATTLRAGDEATLASQHVSIDKTGGVIVHSAATVDLGNGAGASPAPGREISGVELGGQKLTPGGPAHTISGQVYSALPSGAIAVGSGDSQSTLTAESDGQFALEGGQTASVVQVSAPQAPSGIMINGQTLTAGGPALTVSGTTHSALLSGSGIVVASGGTTTTQNPQEGESVLSLGNGQYATIMPTSFDKPTVTSINGQAVSIVTSGIVVDGNTMTAGGAAQTMHGIIYSLQPDGQLIVAGSSTLGNGGLGNLMGAIENMVESIAKGNATSTRPTPSIPGPVSVSTANPDVTRTTIAPGHGTSVTEVLSATSSTQNAASPKVQGRVWHSLGVYLAFCLLFHMA